MIPQKRLLAALAFCVLVVVAGCQTMGLSLSTVPLLGTAPVHLDPLLPSVVHDPILPVTGTTQGGSIVEASVDGVAVRPALTGPDGAFRFDLVLGAVGVHEIVISAFFGSINDAPAEQTRGTVTLAPGQLPVPRLLAVGSDPDVPGLQRVLFAMPPGSKLVAQGATLSPVAGRQDAPSGRFVFRVKVAAGTLPTFHLEDAAGAIGPSTAPTDLGALVDQPPSGEPADRTQVSTVYAIDRLDLVKTETVTLDPKRAELDGLLTSRTDVLGFLRSVAGSSGIEGPGQSRCLLRRGLGSQPDVEIGDTATISVTDDFSDAISSLNGFTNRPVLSLCFPEGLPLLGNEGGVEVRIRDYQVAAIDPRADSISIDRSAPDRPTRIYRWSHVPAGRLVRITLATDVATSLGLLPKARLGDFVRDPDWGPILSSLLYSIVQATGLFLLLRITAGAHAREHWDRGARRAASGVLTVGIALAFVPTIAQLTDSLGYRIAGGLEGILPQVSGDTPLGSVQPSDLGGWLLEIGIGVVGLVAARRFGRDELARRVLTAVGVAAALWLGGSIAGRIAVWIVGAHEGSSIQPRAAAWIVGSALLVALLVHASLRAAAMEPRRVSWSRTGSISLTLVGIAILMALPIGSASGAPDRVGGAVSEFDGLLRTFFSLLSYGYSVFAIAAVAKLIRASWSDRSWESIVGPGPGPGGDADAPMTADERLLRRAGRAIFAGFVIGTAGVFAVLPIPFILAFALFPIAMLRSTSDLHLLAARAGAIRREVGERVAHVLDPEPAAAAAAAAAKPAAASETTVASILASGITAPSTSRRKLGRSTAAAPPPPPASGPARPREPKVTALGAGATIWDNCWFGIKVSSGLAGVLVVLYLAQYSLDRVTTEDAYFIQRFVLNVAAFISSWLIIGFFFGLMFESIRGESGVQKGIWLGLLIIVFTIPFVLLNSLAAGLSPVSITARVLQVLSFTVALGSAFDLRLMARAGRLDLARPGTSVTDLGRLAGTGQVFTGLLAIGGSIVGTVTTIALGELTQLVTHVLTPFLPIPPG